MNEQAQLEAALALIDGGNLAGLSRLLTTSPHLASSRFGQGPADYLPTPTLLELVVENPVRTGRLTPAAVGAARLLLSHGAGTDQAAVQSTLVLTCSGRVARESGLQRTLIGLLCQAGARPDAALLPALAHGEFEAVRALIDHGASVTLPAAAAVGQVTLVEQLLSDAADEERRQALALASQHGHALAVSLLLAAGVPADQFNPAGCHAHSTPLHQAALGGHLSAARLLVAHGARTDTPDLVHGGTPLDWATHAGHTAVVTFLAASDGDNRRR